MLVIDVIANTFGDHIITFFFRTGGKGKLYQFVRIRQTIFIEYQSCRCYDEETTKIVFSPETEAAVMAKRAMQQAVWTAIGLTVARLLLIWFEAWTIAKYQSLILTFFGGFSISFSGSRGRNLM